MCQQRRPETSTRGTWISRGRRSCDWLSLSLSVWLVRGCCCRFVSDGSVSTFLLDDGIEPVVIVGGVLDGARGTVGLQKAVEAFYVTVTIAGLGLALDVVSVWVVHAVHEVVRCRRVGGFHWHVSLCGRHLVSGCHLINRCYLVIG